METTTIFILVAIVVFISGFIFILVRKKQDQSEEKWPPVISNCPDYFVNTSGNMCKNVFKLGDPSVCNGILDAEAIDFVKDSDLMSDDGRKDVCSRIKKCGLSWEGVDNMCA